MKKYIIFIVRVLLTVIFLSFILKTVDFSKTIRLTQSLNIVYVIYAFVLILLIRIIMAIRWNYILSKNNIRVSLKEIIYITYISSSFGQFLPGGLGTDLLRGYQLIKTCKRTAEVSGSIIIDRFIGIYSMLLLALIGAVLARIIGISTGLILTLLVINAVLGFILYLAQVIRVRLNSSNFGKKSAVKTIDKIWSTFADRKKIFELLPGILSLSLFVQIMRCFVFYFLYLAYGYSINVIYFIIFIPILFVITLIPVSIGGLGIREGTLIYFFSTLQIGPEISTGVGIIFQALQVLACLPGFFFWFFRGRASRERCRSVLGKESCA